MGGKRWTKEEEKIMSAHYETSPTIEEVAQMLGRTVCGVFKKGAAMGLRRPDLHDAAIERPIKSGCATSLNSRETAAAVAWKRRCGLSAPKRTRRTTARRRSPSAPQSGLLTRLYRSSRSAIRWWQLSSVRQHDTR
jgi:hypothetical protein